MKILIVSNSQGTTAGLMDEDLYKSYPHLVTKEFPNVNFVYWNMSNLSVDTIDGLFREIVLQHSPDIVIFQVGIIETGFRILPRYVKNVFSVVPFGRIISGFLHTKQKSWRKLLSRLHIIFVDMDKKQFRIHLINILNKMKSEKLITILIRIPLLSSQCNNEWLFDNNKTINDYNDIIDDLSREYGVLVVEPFINSTDSTGDSLFLENSVHFTISGHKLFAENLTESLKPFCK